jgi:hypothetical protein
MRRTLPRHFTFALVVLSFVAVAAVPASAQEQVAAAMNTTALVLPASMTSTVLFPATSTTVANAAEAAGPIPSIQQVQRYNAPRRPSVLPALYATSALLQALDAHSTMKAISVGAHEANPLMKGAASNRGTLIAVKAGVAGASIYLCEKMWKRNPLGAIAVMAVMNGVNAAVVAHNYKVAKSLR